MTIQFINPAGRLNKADLSVEMINKLKTIPGYTVIEPKKVRISISDSVCTSCEG